MRLGMQLKAIHADLLRLEHEFEPQLAKCALHKENARNLWATQVLENLAKTGAPSRAEITDAALANGRNASC